MPFTSAVDIANRACQHVGARRIVALTDASKQAQEINFCYDKLRAAELRRSTWRFATRRATLYPLASTSYRYVPSVYASGTTYAAGMVVQDTTGVYWISMAASNTGNTPGLPIIGQPPYWQQYFGPIVAPLYSASVTYNAGDLVHDATPYFYVSLANNNLNNTPSGGAPWVKDTNTPNYLSLYLIEPAGPGMTISNTGGNPASFARTIFPLPNGYQRALQPDPKVASVSNLVTSAAVRYNDYQFEGNNIISASTTPILLRFVADVSDVSAMDPLFCEGLAARIAYEVCETITQSNVKLQAIAQAYQKFVKDARLINWIETGSTEAQEEEYELTTGPQGVMETPPAAQGGEQA